MLVSILHIKNCWTKFIGVIWKCDSGPVFWDTLYSNLVQAGGRRG